LESEISDDSDINVDLSGSEQRANSADDDNAGDNSDMQHDTWTRVGVERPCFPFNGNPGIDVDLEDRNNPLEYFEFLLNQKLLN
jgi:hypothetical protein